MSLQSLEDFLDKYRTDANFKRAIDNAPDLQAKRRIARQGGFSFNKEDIKKLLYLEKQKELNGSELDTIVGGLNIKGNIFMEELKVIIDIIS